MLVSLSPGAHTISVAYREDGARLDRVLITNGLNLVPSPSTRNRRYLLARALAT